MPHTFLSEIQKGSPHRRAYLLICSWCAVWIGAFTLAGTKLPHYVLPAYPAISIAFGRFLVNWLDGTTQLSRRWLQACWSNLILVGALIVIGLPFVARIYLPGEESLGFIGLIPLIGGLIAFWLHKQEKRFLAVVAVTVIAVALPIAGLGWGATRIDQYQKSHIVAQWLRELERKPDSTTFATYQCFNESLVFYCDRNVKKLAKPSDVYAFLNSSGSEDAFLLTTADQLQRLKELSSGVVIVREAPRFLKPGRLVLLGRKPSPSSPALASRQAFHKKSQSTLSK